MHRRRDPIAILAEGWKADGSVPPHALVMPYCNTGGHNDEGVWVEPLPTPGRQHSKWNGVTNSYGNDELDQHNLLGWYEKQRNEEGSGYFLLCRGLIFDAKDGDAAVTAWAAHNAMRIAHMAPNAWRSDRPWRFCVPEATSPFLSTFRAWLIVRFPSVSKRHRSLFWDIVFCHDSFFARIGLQESSSRGGDLRELMVWYLLMWPLEPSESGDEAYVAYVNEKRSMLLDCDVTAFRRFVKDSASRETLEMCKITRSLYGKYKWTRLRVLWLLRKRCLVLYHHLHQELRFRPGNAGASEAYASFHAAMATL